MVPSIMLYPTQISIMPKLLRLVLVPAGWSLKASQDFLRVLTLGFSSFLGSVGIVLEDFILWGVEHHFHENSQGLPKEI